MEKDAVIIASKAKIYTKGFHQQLMLLLKMILS